MKIEYISHDINLLTVRATTSPSMAFLKGKFLRRKRILWDYDVMISDSSSNRKKNFWGYYFKQ